MSVLVFGSLNMDLVTRTHRLPQAGETIAGYSFETVPGGKGANQAVAVARLEVPVHMGGRVGGDEFGKMLIESLQLAGVNCEGIKVDETTRSGVAAIAIDDSGENHIIIVAGANGQVDASDVDRLPLLEIQVLLLQLEIPLAIVLAAAQVAKQAGITVILDPAPAANQLPAELYAAIDILTPNQVEAEQLTGIAVQDQASAILAARRLRQQGIGTVIIKMGAQGALCATAAEEFWVSPFAVRAIDTVAAGDAFNGGLAAALAEGRSLPEACRWAAAAGALATTVKGAQSAMPTRAELIRLMS
ncbi:MAG: ribokinase [Timaviella obliquedivisa GSE-PSE-MK23-08B]|jgi:ribokinase|nr:ribokinase [Timaviella obliquedivisa GSE-PSE-MK23-08B]